MASQAEIDLIVNATRTLDRLEDDLRQIVRIAEARAPRIDLDVDVDRGSTRRVTAGLLSVTRGLTGLVSAGSAVGSIPPIMAAVAASVQTILPAAALATSAMTSMALVSGTLKLAFNGVEDAITAAFDPEATEEYAEALEKLAPEARDFVEELRGMRSQLRNVQQLVQQNFFRGFDDSLRDLAQNTSPALTRALDATSRSLNTMAREAASAASELGRRGILGQALDSATASLENLERVPAQATTAFGQLAAASGPAMERVTRAVQRAADRIAGRLAAAFESGDLERAIDDAVSAIAQLGRIGGNILSGLGNIIGGVTSKGQGLFFILEDLSEAFERLTESEEFQTILSELVLTAQTLVDNVLPLLERAFEALAPVIKEIGPPLRDFLDTLGEELKPVIDELAPVLLDLAKIFKEQMPFAIEITKTALQILVIALQALHVLLNGIILPAVRTVARAFDDYGGVVKGVTGDVDDAVGGMTSRFSDFQLSMNADVIRIISRVGEIPGAFASLTRSAFDTVFQTTAAFGTLPGRLIQVVAGLASSMFAIGQQIVNGLVGGMLSMLGRVQSIAQEIASTVSEAVTGLLQISSPSRLFRDIGIDTVAGLIQGIERSLPDLAAASLRMGDVVVSGGTPGTSVLSLPTQVAAVPSVTVQIGNTVIDDHIRVITRTERDFRDRRLAQGVRR